MDKEKWSWQKPGTIWKGAGLYHITLTIPSRKPLLGELIIPDNDPANAVVKALPLGRLVLEYQRAVSIHYPEIQILHYCLMPDHIHAVWYVRQKMPRSIKQAVRGFWQGAKKAGRAWGMMDGNKIAGETTKKGDSNIPYITKEVADTLSNVVGRDLYGQLDPVFTDIPFIRTMGHHRQLPATIRYIDMNPQRLATRKLKPGYFCVQRDIEISGRIYSGVGNAAILTEDRYMPVHVRWTMIDEARHGDDRRLKEYMSACMQAAREGAVMVSPFISPEEKQIQAMLLEEGLPFICIADNGFGEYYKPADGLFDAVAAGKVMILSPWEYDPQKMHVTRTECVAMNKMAEEICEELAGMPY